jgi:hypothetical protein
VPRAIALHLEGAFMKLGVAHFNVHATPQGASRRPLWGTLDEIREDIERYADAGLTELFLEGNFNPRGARLDEALEAMAALAPRKG